MAYRNDWIRLIRQLAAKYRVDPRAALAVASAEGLGGGVGDQGTSFGPFQLHVGGALPAGRGRAWAESPAGIEYALRQIGQVAGGLQGRAAISNIVQRFERPANPGGEIQRALGAYNQFGGGTPPAASPRSPMVPASPAAPVQFDPRGQILQQLASGGNVNFLALARRMANAPAPQPAAPISVRRTQARPATRGAFQTADRGKLIGFPYQGTHTLYGNWESDNAVDISLKKGTPIYAPAAGVIGSQIGPLGSGDPRLQGNRLHLVTPGNEYYLAHLSRLAVKAGQRVVAGQLLGYSGSANGSQHLHIATRKGKPQKVLGL